MDRRGSDPTRKPHPAHTTQRAADLPWCAPKPGHEDDRAPDLVREIMASLTYARADEDMTFLNRDDMRGTRLLLDYQRAETLLEGHGIAHSIVFFAPRASGSLRMPTPGSWNWRLSSPARPATPILSVALLSRRLRATSAAGLERLPEPLRRLTAGARFPVEIAPALVELAQEADRILNRT
ncbi:hypothetical protein [Tropicimonas sp. IMCC6043]|uniref:hypothetical protein n=1 Tax=Tropicimonas sp. IMCC6043 TaxID=2510645 RepID=UPI00101B6088|nr:hypothetical protein [Tropicimonas sp. IMCC6043]RYH07027.1 hypothetical protein EU800_21610 [Tropicimonas sp. IMCC6043]